MPPGTTGSLYKQMDGEYKVWYDSNIKCGLSWSQVEGKSWGRGHNFQPNNRRLEDLSLVESSNQDDVNLMVTVVVMSRLPPACSVSISFTKTVRDKFLCQVIAEYAATGPYTCGRFVYKHVNQELYNQI